MSPAARHAFVLVELLLALAILTMAVLSMFALFASSLRHTTGSEGDTMAALFADATLNGLRARSDQAADTNAWEAFWQSFAAGAEGITVAVGGAAGVWTAESLEVRSGGVRTLAFTNYSMQLQQDTERLNHALRYEAATDFTLDTDTLATNAACVTLRVWRGRVGPTNAARTLTFYTEYLNPMPR